MKWVKRLFYTLVVLIVVALGLGVAVWFAKGKDPEWLRKYDFTGGQLEAASRRIEDKLLNFRQWAGDHHRAERMGSTSRPRVPTDPTSPPPDRVTLSLDEEELNALFVKWSAGPDGKWDEKFSRYAENPLVNLVDGRIVLAAKIKEIGSTLSVHFEPSLEPDPSDSSGQRKRLRMTIARVQTGIVPVPEAVWGTQRDKLGRAMLDRLGPAQRKAAIVEDGSMNADAVGAAMNKLLLAALYHDTAEPVLFLPHDPTRRDRALPVRLTDVRVEGRTLTITAIGMKPAERRALLDRIREPYHPKAASVFTPGGKPRDGTRTRDVLPADATAATLLDPIHE